MVAEVKNLNNKIAEMELTIQHLNDQLTWFRRQMFGMKSERVTDFPCNTPDLPGFDFGNAEIEILPKSHIKPHDRKQSKSRKGEFKLEVGENVEVVEKVIDIPEVDKIDPATGKKLVCIGYDKSDKLVDPKLLPKSKLCDAIKYMLSYEKNFKFYLVHSDAKMDNAAYPDVRIYCRESSQKNSHRKKKLDVSWKQAKRKSNGKSYDSYSKL